MKDFDGDSQASRALFERAVLRLDPGTANRLRLARRDALAGASGREGRRAWPSALAASALLVLGLAWWLPQRASRPVPAPASAQVAAPAEADVLADDGEDVELYAWLGEAPVASDPDPEQRL